MARYRYVDDWHAGRHKDAPIPQFLEACKRLGIPKDETPFADFHPYRHEKLFAEMSRAAALVGGKGHLLYRPDPLVLPTFGVLFDDWAEWEGRAQAAFDEHCKVFKAATRRDLAQLEKAGKIERVKQPRTSGRITPTEVRYEWAAEHVCRNKTFGQLARRPWAGKTYSRAQIGLAVRRILADLGLDPGT